MATIPLELGRKEINIVPTRKETNITELDSQPQSTQDFLELTASGE